MSSSSSSASPEPATSKARLETLAGMLVGGEAEGVLPIRSGEPPAGGSSNLKLVEAAIVCAARTPFPPPPSPPSLLLARFPFPSPNHPLSSQLPALSLSLSLSLLLSRFLTPPPSFVSLSDPISLAPFALLLSSPQLPRLLGSSTNQNEDQQASPRGPVDLCSLCAP